jgi:predicted GNAT superfamily acetyltransferase
MGLRGTRILSCGARRVNLSRRATIDSAAMRLRDLDSLDDFDAVARLQREVWGEDCDDHVPRSLLVVALKIGGILIGAEDEDGRLAGVVLSMPGVRDGHALQWSHMLGVAPRARGQGLGRRLKLAQRERALSRGTDLIEWTYDPLLAGNAHLNVRRLGCVAESYLENVYGDSTSPLHGGGPTDRFIATWHIASPHVARRVEAGVLVARDAAVGAAPSILATRADGMFRAPGEPELDHDEPRVRVEIPADFQAMTGAAPDLALAWRHASRRVFPSYFARGYRVVDVDAGRGIERPSYLLARRQPTS